MIAVTGATGQLGRLVIASLLKRVPANQIVAAARTPSKAADLAALGVQVREADYSRPATLAKAFAGATSLLLISSPSMDTRVAEHEAVIDAAKTAGVLLLAYTSVLRADTSTLLVAPDHLATEHYLAASGLAWVFLRHPPYIENYTASLGASLEHKAIVGSAGNGRNSAATRADLADVAAVVLTTQGHAGKIYELGGDVAFTMVEFAAELSRQSGEDIFYKDLLPQAYQAVLEDAGLPAKFAHLIADSDAKAASHNELYTASRDLGDLIGRPTTTLAAAIAAALSR
jgi:NAD(P)H dehydrogenase (quinone)